MRLIVKLFTIEKGGLKGIASLYLNFSLFFTLSSNDFHTYTPLIFFIIF